MIGIKASAHDIEVKNDDGVTIYYKWINNKTKLAVTYRGENYDSYSNTYTGDVVIPKSVTYNGKTYSVTSIEQLAFNQCTELTSVTIPNSLVSIGDGAFIGCTSLSTMSIPNSVTIIGNYTFNGCTNLLTVNIPNTVTKIGNGVFKDCSNLTSIDIPNNTTSIGDEAFSGCLSLASIVIPMKVKNIGYCAFIGCTDLNSIIVESGNTTYDSRNNSNAIIETNTNKLVVGCKATTIPNSVTGINDNAFMGCTGLTSITISNNISSIGKNAFAGCTELTSIIVESGNNSYDSRDNCNAIIETNTNTLLLGCKNTIIPNSVKSIGEYSFIGCNGLTSVNIPNSVKDIGSFAFSGCTGLTSVNIPNSVTNIGIEAFSGCTGLTSVNIPNSVINIDFEAFAYCTGLTSLTIPNSNTRIGDGAFYRCKNLKSIIISDNITSIGLGAFEETAWINSQPDGLIYIGKVAYTYKGTMPNKTSIVIKEGTVSITSYAFFNCDGLISIDIPYSVIDIQGTTCYGCINLEKVIINSNAIVSENQSSTYSSFANIFGQQVKEYVIGDDVSRIGSYTFSDCKDLTSVIIGNSVTEIDDKAFSGTSAKFYVNRGTDGLLSLWNYGVEPYEIGEEKILYKPSIAVTTTQSSITYKDKYNYPELRYESNDEHLVNNEFIKKWLCPETQYNVSLTVRSTNNSFIVSKEAYTASISPKVTCSKTASSITGIASYTKGDANVTWESLTFNGKAVKGNSFKVSGLDPYINNSVKYTIEVTYGEKQENKASYTSTATITTANLTMTTLQPKVISVGNVIVAAESNLDDEETNVGFEWRRTDWTDDFASNTGAAYLYEGTMEGYIRNLNAEKLWKFRPYYESNSGKRYYGDWVGLDPTNTSYFEPTVHTYAKAEVNGNTAEVKGYAQRGTDNVTSQGFKYWKRAAGARRAEGNIPADAMTIEVKGQVMTAQLTGLDYESDYCYVAFVTTSENETFYGEMQTFKTGVDTSGIEDARVSEEPTVIVRYDLRGRRLNAPQTGVNILKMSDGTTRKVFVK